MDLAGDLLDQHPGRRRRAGADRAGRHPATAAPRADRLRGAVLVAVGMGLSVLGFEQAPTWGWANPLTWVCIVGGLVVLAVFVRFEVRTATAR